MHYIPVQNKISVHTVKKGKKSLKNFYALYFGKVEKKSCSGNFEFICNWYYMTKMLEFLLT